MSDFLLSLQEDVVGRLASDAYFVDIPILEQRKGIAENDVLTALGALNAKSGKNGVCVIVAQPEASGENPDVPGPELKGKAIVQILEDPLVNTSTTGTGKNAGKVATECLSLLHHFVLSPSSVLYAEQDCLRPFDAGLPGVTAYEVRLSCAGHLPIVASVAQPQCTLTAGYATLSTVTPSASIYYTLNGTFPYSGNNAASLYSSPVAVTSGQTLRAAAYLSGVRGSSICEVTA